MSKDGTQTAIRNLVLADGLAPDGVHSYTPPRFRLLKPMETASGGC